VTRHVVLTLAAVVVVAQVAGFHGGPVNAADPQPVAVLLICHSATGNTEKMAQGVAEGAKADLFKDRKMRNKVGAAFSTGASVSAGKEFTILGILAAMLNNQMIIVSGGGGFGASATTGPDSPGIDEKELAAGRDLGKRVAEVAAVVKRGSGRPQDAP
jgi:multimeric flavodoxin WrbA